MIALALFVVLSSGHGGHVAAQVGSTPSTDSAEATSEVVDVVSTVILPTDRRLPSRFEPSRERDLIVALHGFGSRRIPFALARSSAKTLREVGDDISFYAIREVID